MATDYRQVWPPWRGNSWQSKGIVYAPLYPHCDKAIAFWDGTAWKVKPTVSKYQSEVTHKTTRQSHYNHTPAHVIMRLCASRYPGRKEKQTLVGVATRVKQRTTTCLV